MQRLTNLIVLCAALGACESGPVSLGAMTDSGIASSAGGSGGAAGSAGSAGTSGEGGQGGSGGLPVAKSCGAAVCVDGTACCSESCGLCTATAGECRAIECASPDEACEADACPGPAPLAPSQMCDDGSLAGPACERNDADACAWTVRSCPPPGTGTTCGTRGAPSCADGEYCRYSPRAHCGASDAPGTCTPTPMSCSSDDHPVCGCDGTSYRNACLAASQGVSVASAGKCEGEPGEGCGPGGEKCGAGQYCARTSCNATNGACESTPQACDANFDPVCGCDGKTYGNDCEAASAGVNVASRDACDEPGGDVCGGFVGAGCPKGQYCDYAAGDGCDVSDGQGRCKPQPEICTLEYDPVCGCDGKTYGNACAAASEGVSVASPGECS